MRKEAPRLLPVEPRLAGRSCGVLTRLRKPGRHDSCEAAAATTKLQSCDRISVQGSNLALPLIHAAET